MASSVTGRALHFVFKVGKRAETTRFYRDVLGMKFLRHEEFEKGCEAACNGPYDGRWSKSMVGYGPEDSHFVIELTYNYGIGTYPRGNDFKGIHISSAAVHARVCGSGWPCEEAAGGVRVVRSPDGHPFFVSGAEDGGDPVKMVTLSSSNLQNSIDYWRGKCGMSLQSQDSSTALLGFTDAQCGLRLEEIAEPVEHAKAFGRIAFACPSEQLAPLEARMVSSGQAVLTPLVSLDTPGKATVQVVILADPDGHEICFVGDEAFRELSQVDPKADDLLDQAMAADKSDEWFAKKGKSKATA